MYDNNNEWEFKEVLSNEDEIVCNIPQQILNHLSKPRKISTEKMAESVDFLITICKQNERYTSYIPHLVKLRHKLEHCGNFSAWEIVYIESQDIETHVKVNGFDCHTYLICPRCQWLRMWKMGTLTYKMVREIEAEKPNHYDYYLITLTKQDRKQIGIDGHEIDRLTKYLQEDYDALNKALSKLKDRDIWKDVVEGDVTCFECVPSEKRYGFHPHWHIVIAIWKDNEDFKVKYGGRRGWEFRLMQEWAEAINSILGTDYSKLHVSVARLKHSRKKKDLKAFTEERKYNYIRQGEMRTGYTALHAKLGSESGDIALIVARAVMYCTKPNDRLLYENKLKHSGCKASQKIAEFAAEYDEENKDDYVNGKPVFSEERTARLILPILIVLSGKRCIRFSGIFKKVKPVIEERDKKNKEFLMKQPSEKKRKYVVNWQFWWKKFSITVYEKMTREQKEKLLSPPKKRKKQQATDTMVKEMPEAVRNRLIADIKDEIEGQLPLEMNAPEMLSQACTATMRAEVESDTDAIETATESVQTAGNAFSDILYRPAYIGLLPMRQQQPLPEQTPPEPPPKSECYGDYEQYCLF